MLVINNLSLSLSRFISCLGFLATNSIWHNFN